MKWNMCEKDYRIKPFVPIGKDGKAIFTINRWFFAYCKCDCGEFILNKEELKKGKEDD